MSMSQSWGRSRWRAPCCLYESLRVLLQKGHPDIAVGRRLARNIEAGLEFLQRPLKPAAILARNQAGRLAQRQGSDRPLGDDGVDLLCERAALLQRAMVARILLAQLIHAHQHNPPAA